MKKYLLVILFFFATNLVACKKDVKGTTLEDGGKSTQELEKGDSLYVWTKTELLVNLEAEDAMHSEVRVSTSQAGFSGNGYLDGFYGSGNKVEFTVNVPEYALYKVELRYACEGGNHHNLLINTSPATSINFSKTEGFEAVNLGKYPLKKGKNKITIKGGWGNVLIDKLSVYTAPKNTYNVASKLVDEKANAGVKEVYKYLSDNYGKKIISGFLEGKAINGLTSKPLLYAWDFGFYTEGYPWAWSDGNHVFGAVDNGSVQQAADWYRNTKKQGLVSFQWHWGSPSGGKAGTNTFYTEYTTFDVREAVKDGTPENLLVIRDIDAIALQLRELENSGVTVLFRPLHEAGGGWFWWGAKGAEPCKQLYDIIFYRLKDHHQLRNLIWVWSSSEKEWYPGNDKVDIVGHDSYPGDYNYGAQNYSFQRLYDLTGGEKIIAMTENGPIPDPDDCLKHDTPWSFFMSWGDLLYSQNSPEHIAKVFGHKNVISIKP